MLEEPAIFDATTALYVELFDRATWPLVQRSMIIAAARGAIPTYFIPDDQLSDEQRARRVALGAEEAHESVQEQVLTDPPQD